MQGLASRFGVALAWGACMLVAASPGVAAPLEGGGDYFVLDLMALSESGGPWHSVGSSPIKAPGGDAKVGTELALVEVGGRWARVSLGGEGWVAELGCGSSTIAFKSNRAGAGNESEQPTSRCQGEWLRARISRQVRP